MRVGHMLFLLLILLAGYVAGVYYPQLGAKVGIG